MKDFLTGLMSVEGVWSTEVKNSLSSTVLGKAVMQGAESIGAVVSTQRVGEEVVVTVMVKREKAMALQAEGQPLWLLATLERNSAVPMERSHRVKVTGITLTNSPQPFQQAEWSIQS